MTDEQAIKKTLNIALKGSGNVSPNPRVGALIMKDDKILSEGAHEYFGGPHAEVNAISKCTDDELEGSTIYVNLEPCSHHGKTPPCTDLIITKKIARVVIGTIDPNELMAGKSIEILKNAGIEVESGISVEACHWVNRFFFKYIQTGFPYIILKVAQSLDGVIALKSGVSQWITCSESRRRSHYLRSIIDAVLVGKNTVLMDKPALTVRETEGRNPKRVIFDTNLEIPLESPTFQIIDNQETIVCCSPESYNSRKANTLKIAKIKVQAVDLDSEGRIDPKQAISLLAKNFNICSIMVEGGAILYSSFAKNGLIDELHTFIAPKIIGSGINAFSELKIDSLKNSVNFETKLISKSGEDIHIISVPKK
ncbi:MAG: bifunctional diaminohydroxyphosphoribosylaminopyrimidine deaminase/5-amino-6-(5-phosphoribosylamino)uracil reductase RibD [Candidatus Kapabacteria bacterium]|nr:bifunctional diaminohydroxyphosphoribosylaminopyrimidine deaminase/5-amino-6-(5-phosphoribosylamino)uracil reductase RibD [Candidatus Kapabacteria bacterium]